MRPIIHRSATCKVVNAVGSESESEGEGDGKSEGEFEVERGRVGGSKSTLEGCLGQSATWKVARQ